MEGPIKSLVSSTLFDKRLDEHKQNFVSTKVQRVHCPTCGSSAERYFLFESGTIRTQCSHCDYLMETCADTGRVIEAYSPSFSPDVFAACS